MTITTLTSKGHHSGGGKVLLCSLNNCLTAYVSGAVTFQLFVSPVLEWLSPEVTGSSSSEEMCQSRLVCHFFLY